MDHAHRVIWNIIACATRETYKVSAGKSTQVSHIARLLGTTDCGWVRLLFETWGVFAGKSTEVSHIARLTGHDGLRLGTGPFCGSIVGIGMELCDGVGWDESNSITRQAA